MRIVDAHHHLWDLEQNRYPWLMERVDHPAGDYSAIMRSYRIEDFFRDASGFELEQSVHVQAEFDHDDDPVKETAWLQSVADSPKSRGMPGGIVGYADLSGPDAEETLARHASHENARGIRQMLNYRDGEPLLNFAPRGDLMQDPQWRDNYRRLASHGLSFDLQVWPWQLEDAARLAKDIPETQVVLNHTGMPHYRDSEERKTWRAGMRALAEAPHASVKISGLAMFGTGWTPEDWKPYVLGSIEAFGVDRCMFASNFPVDSLFASYDAIWNAFDQLTSGFSEAERDALFRANALRIYRLPVG
ncbi:MAG: amidohydrolase family protein [Chloroflexota bacterium]